MPVDSSVTTPIILLYPIIGIALFFIAVHTVMRFFARRAGFRKTDDYPIYMGAELFFYRWGSVRTGWTVYGRNVRITGYENFIHLKLMAFFGGGEMLLPMRDAQFEFSQGLYGEVVDVCIGDRRYGFGRDVAKMVRLHYC